MDNNTIILNPDYHLKNDIDRIILYSKAEVAEYSDSNWIGFIHPAQGMIFASFIEGKPFNEVVDSLSSKFDLSIEDTKLLVRQFINNEVAVRTEYKGVSIWLPRNILINVDRLKRPYTPRLYKQNVFSYDKIDLTDERLHKGPLTMTLMLTNKCITNCKYCYANKSYRYEELTTHQIFNIIHQASDLELANIDIIGGEVFCKKDWQFIIKELVRLDLTPSYISTKVPITKDIARKLFDTGYNGVIQLSIDTLDETMLKDIISCKKDYIKKLINGIDILQQYQFKVQVNTILTKYADVFQINQLFDFVKTLKNLKYWEIRTPQRSMYNTITYNEIKLDASKVIDLYAYIEKEIIAKSTIPIELSMDHLAEEYKCNKIASKTLNETTCPALNGSFFVLPDGKVTICEELYVLPQFIIGDLKYQTISEVWNSPEVNKLLYGLKRADFQEASPCRICKSFDLCMASHKRCWAKVVSAYGFDNWDYPDPRCESAPILPNGILY